MMFPTGAILSVVTNRYLGIPCIEIQKVLNFMTGDDVYTHQIPRINMECGPVILERYPHLLDDSEGLEVGGEEWVLWVEKKVEEFGAMIDIQSLTDNTIHEVIDPCEEMARLAGPDKIIIIDEMGNVETIEERCKKFVGVNSD